MTTAATALSPCPILMDGEWTTPRTAETMPVHNPSTGEIIAEVPMCGAELVDQAVKSCRAAFHDWWQTPHVERARVMFRYQALLEENFEALAQGITREHGKTLTEARGDARRGIEVVEYACAVTEFMKGEILENVARGIDCEMVRQPVGICAGICPYNFPALVPMWMYPLALVCGNCFVLKPSEKVPLTAIRLVELLMEAGLPKGVLNLVHGGKECVDAILKHDDIQAVSFVGSSPVAKYIYETGTAHGKRVQAAGGAKNFVLIMPDAKMDEAVAGMADASFGCSGQRCMAASTAVTVGKAADDFVPMIADAAKRLKVGPTDRDPSAKLGGVITAQHRDRVASLIEAGEKEGARVVADGRLARVEEFPNGFYLGASVIDEVQEGMTIFNEEIFGPVLNVMRFEDFDHALDVAARSAFGNGNCIYTQSGRYAREFKHRAKAGMIGINVGVPAPLAYFPFSGWDYSFFGDLHIQGKEAIYFFTRAKVTTSRWFSAGEGDVWHKD